MPQKTGVSNNAATAPVVVSKGDSDDRLERLVGGFCCSLFSCTLARKTLSE